MNRRSYILIIPLLVMCQSDKTEKTQNGQSRIEQVKARPYRNLELTDNQENTITGYIQETLTVIRTLEGLKLFYVTRSGGIIEIRRNWDSSKDVIDTSYELWREKDILATIAVYRSFSANATNGDESKLYVIEVEHKELTGTCRMFFDSPEDKKLTGLSYTDRN
jgi:hypothetical protein